MQESNVRDNKEKLRRKIKKMAKEKNLVRFNIQNAKFAVQSDSGYGAIVPFSSSTKMALEGDISSKKIYGDGVVIATLVNDKGKTGVLTCNNITDEYELAMGRKIQTDSGLADIKQTKTIKHAIYFEICNLTESGKTTVAKTWLFGCVSITRPSESYDQSTDDINESSFDNGFEVHGIKLLAADDTVYKDENGTEMYAWQITSVPGDAGYETFGDSVPTPKLLS